MLTAGAAWLRLPREPTGRPCRFICQTVMALAAASQRRASKLIMAGSRPVASQNNDHPVVDSDGPVA